jgi:CHAT domain-containing protein/tetratricopeptide (TPR) repeat protein
MLATGCGPSAYDELRALDGHLPDRWVRALAAESPQELEDLIETSSADYLIQVESGLNDALATSSLAAFTESVRVLQHPLTRTRQALRTQFGFERNWELHEEFFSLPREDAFQAQREWRRLVTLADDESVAMNDRAIELRRSLDRADSLGRPTNTALLWLWTFRRFLDAGDQDAALEALQRAILRAEQQGNHTIHAHALGILGSFHRSQGEDELMEQVWQRALAVAIDHQLAGQSGRILEFYANYYEPRGQLDLARNLFRDAERQSESLGGSPDDIRFLANHLGLNSRLGCWDAVERALPRAPRLLERIGLWHRSSKGLPKRTAEVEHFEARLRLAQRRFDQANNLFSSALDHSEDAEAPALGCWIRMDWARSQIAQGQPRAAIDLLEPCLASDDTIRTLAPTLVILAEAYSKLEDWDACEARLSEFRGLGLDEFESNFREAVRAREIMARVQVARDRVAEALEIVASACDSIELELIHYEASQAAFLHLQDLEPLHLLINELVDPRTEAAFALERAWRKVPGLLGQGHGYDRDDSPLQECKRILREAHVDAAAFSQLNLVQESALPTDGALEILYLLDVDSLERWTRVGNLLAYDAVAVDPHAFQARIETILAELGARVEEHTTLDADMEAELRSLANLLLPDLVFDRTDDVEERRKIRFQPANVLSGFPFGTLNLSGESYVPLVSRFDPAYERGVSGPTLEAPSSGPGLIVADPKLNPGLAAWTSGLPALPHAAREARALHEWKPESVLLEGRAATKAALRRHWRRAGLIYFASHVVQDPSSPYLSFIPLAAENLPQGQPLVRSNEMLDIQDVRKSRLVGQPLVVLSACSSGVPYQSGSALAPSLGDAFIDAGARGVIHTLWSVRDDAAAELLHDAMRAWSVEGVDPVSALSDARRRMASGGRFAHPYFWGSTVVQIRGR